MGIGRNFPSGFAASRGTIIWWAKRAEFHGCKHVFLRLWLLKCSGLYDPHFQGRLLVDTGHSAFIDQNSV